MTTATQTGGSVGPSLAETPPPSWLRPLGFWASILWLAIALIVSVFAILLLLALTSTVINIDRLNNEIATNFIFLITSPVIVGVLILASRRTEWSSREYFAAVRPRQQALLIASLGVGAISLVEILLGYYLDIGIGDFTTDLEDFRVTRAAGVSVLALYCFNLLIVGPIAEEIIFRGFLYRGWSHALGPVAAIVLTAILFGSAHVQYSWDGMADVAVSGVFLGWLRWHSGSIIPSILAHAAMNVVALIALVIAA